MVAGKRAGEPAKGRQKGPRAKEKPAAKAARQEASEKQQPKPKPQPAPELSADEKSDIFFQHRRRYIAAKEKQDAAKAALRTVSNDLTEVLKDAKAEGISREDFEISVLLDSPEGEEKVQAKLARTIEVAKWMGSTVGTQFEMFEDRTPAVDIARKKGERDSQDNLSRSPPYDPSTEQYRAYMEGYNAHQERLMKGYKPPPSQNGHTDGQPSANEAADGRPAGSVPLKDKDGEEVTSGTPVSRAEFRQGLAANESVVKEIIGNQPASFQVQ